MFQLREGNLFKSEGLGRAIRWFTVGLLDLTRWQGELVSGDHCEPRCIRAAARRLEIERRVLCKH